MKVFAVISIGRQVFGDFVLIRTDKAFFTANKAEEYLQQKKKEYVATDGKAKAILMKTDNGDVECICQVGVFEIEVEE